jgi:hypothetical protein
MPTVDKAREVLTLIHVFTVEPEKQRKLTDLLGGATQETMRKLTGFPSANIRRSLDGKRVVNYAQWHRDAPYILGCRFGRWQ